MKVSENNDLVCEAIKIIGDRELAVKIVKIFNEKLDREKRFRSIFKLIASNVAMNEKIKVLSEHKVTKDEILEVADYMNSHFL